jgi:type I restriction enzyme, S subunit
MKKGWQTKTLGEICTVDWGNTDLTKSAYVEGGKFLAVSAAGCDGRIGHKEHEKYTPVLSAIGAQCGRMFLPEEDFTAIKNTITLTPRDGTCTGRFLFQLLTHVELPKRGAAQPFISKGDIQSFQVPVPPLAEQQRIVGLLDEAFEGLATARANAEKNLQNARDLFESHLQSVFTQRGPGWVEKPLAELCERITKGSSPKWQGISYVDAPGILFVTSENVGEYDILLEQPKYVEEKFNAKDKKSILKNGDVLTNIVGASIGRTAVFDRDDVANINQAVCLIRCEPHLLNNHYLTYLLNSPVFKQVLHDNEVNNARANLSLGFFSQLPVPMPPIPKQKEIVAKLDAFREETQRLARLYERKHAALEALKKSLLHQAFAGEL